MPIPSRGLDVHESLQDHVVNSLVQELPVFLSLLLVNTGKEIPTLYFLNPMI